jgi:hypothetical protein
MLPICYINEKYTVGMTHNLNKKEFSLVLKRRADMKWAIIVSMQSVLWCGYIIVEWLSKKDSFQAKMILFVMFLYVSYLAAAAVLHSKKMSFTITVLTAAAALLLKDGFIFIVITLTQ